MNDPNNATCFLCGSKCELYDEYMYAWKFINDKADFCGECVEEIIQKFYDEESMSIHKGDFSVVIRDMITRSREKRKIMEE